jgi:hypothetical protein
MSFFEDASLVLIPSAYKDQKVYSVKPTDGTGDLTFSRASSATRVQSDGLIEKVRTNLVLQSEAFNTTWAVTGIVVTANTAANPLTGTTTADTITADAASNFHLITQSITYSANENTVSVYVKANGYTWFLIDPSITNAFGYFNVTTGAVGTKGSACTTSISNVGGGWYRCSVTFTASAGAAICNFSIRNADNGGAFLGDGVSGFFVYGAQVETGVTTDYIATTTAAVSVGPVSGLPRLDYLGSTCPRLLLEPQRTNSATYSEQFDNVAWSKYQCSITSNNAISPDGTQNADKLTLSGGSGTYTGLVFRVASPLANSVYMKNDSIGSGKFIIQVDGVGSAKWNSDGTLSSVSGGTATNAESVGNGWFRFTYVVTSGAYINFGIENGTTGSSIYIWGAQLEAGAYATSYIPTLGASVTRVAETTSRSGLGLTNSTFVLNFQILALSVELFDFTKTGGGRMFYIAVQSGGFVTFNSVSGGSIGAIGTPLAINTSHKIAFTLNASTSNVGVFINGVKIGTYATDITTFGAFSALQTFGFDPASKVEQILIFPSVLSDAQAIELTA